ncbi:flavohemoglobin expression-modulating QEGLA motif protein [Clostridium sp. DL1XJH146]
MLKLSIEEIIKKIKKEELLDVTVDDGSFSIVIEKYVPFICTAIHNGSNFSKELQEKSILNKQDRWNEEDPLTGDFIDSLPINIIVNDSRYEYDLNREEKDCIYDTAWGKQVWIEKLPEDMKKQGIEKHRNFYKVLDALVLKIEEKFNTCIIYDVHSYNYKRDKVHNEYPVFNLGTERINTPKNRRYISKFISELNKIKFEDFDNLVAENEVFFGRGYLAKHVQSIYSNTIVMPLEVKKIYCNENTGDIYPSVVNTLKEGLKNAIITNSLYYINKEANTKIKNKTDLLSNIEDPILKKVDAKLYSLLKNFETLTYVNPKNLERCRRQFFDSGYRHIPEFSYIPLKVDTYDLKKNLYALPITDISDVSVQLMYKEIINEYSTTIDMLTSRGTEDFLYNSMKLYGKPSKDDVKNANYVIQSYGLDDDEDKNLTKEKVLKLLKNEIDNWGMGGKITFSKNMAARIMVNSSKRTLVVNDKAKFNSNDIKLLSQHELGVHMLTTMNAIKQPLKFLQLGTPNNVETQEGLAVLAECLTGNIHINRLKDLAYRVVAVNLMVKGYGFKDIFEYLMDEHNFDKDSAFNLTARVMRGGGFTKDYIYLKGFIKVYNYYIEGNSLEELLIGKTSLEYIDLFKELINRGHLKKPTFKNNIYKEGELDNKIIEYILKSTKNY